MSTATDRNHIERRGTKAINIVVGPVHFVQDKTRLVIVQETKTAVEVAFASNLERVVVKVSHAKLDGIAAIILIATRMQYTKCHYRSYCHSIVNYTSSRTIYYLIPIPVYEYHYYTITWSYWSYYYYYYTIHLDLSASTHSTKITTTTTISINETNSAAASSSFKQFSATLSFPTPTTATLPIQTPPSSPTQTQQTTNPHTEVSIDKEFLRGTGSALSSVFGTPSTTTSSVTSGSSSSSTATTPPVEVKVSGASGINLDGHFWSITGSTVFGACIVAL
ncbi:uncharacterized protein EAF01_004919 [Botrytis porri]|uniref:Uncharacterized protein n=1 Tax=Botrytis porri TaxID=87229 RepID=A0A4Z1KYK8_9HELO|nr:uncharacterized protein EAF01_004919 [Botrytis porri]KAF7907332.1 hypothetical protein EAF01_004919 [Botrytis porri]TGO89665.1 hypothetical protein BPOR_0099g00200 [Botrytis porri]